jgi:hypothetical protein
MRKSQLAALFVAVLCLSALDALAKTSAPAKAGEGTIVIVFKDGHRQSFSLADIERVEFPSASASNSASSLLPPRFIGKWRVGDGNGNDFNITLEETGDAKRSLGGVHGHWVFEDGEARISWDDGAQDAIRKTASGYQKRAFHQGKSFADDPDNVDHAENLTHHPI